MILDDEVRAFLATGVAILLASRDRHCVPSVARAKGCRVTGGEPPSLRIILSAAQAGPLLDDVCGTGMIAATFSVPDTHRTLQFKGSDARIEPVDEDDRVAARACVEAFTAALVPLGFSAEFRRTIFASPGDEVAVVFTPDAAFQQTPGPAAGARIA